jgi:hypothetical protein
VVDVDLLAVLGQHLRRKIGERHADAVVVEVDADRDSGGAVEPEEHRRSASARVPLAVGFLDDKPARLQVGDEAADGRPGEPGHAREVAAASETASAQGVDHEGAVALSKHASRPLAVEPGHLKSSSSRNYVESRSETLSYCRVFVKRHTKFRQFILVPGRREEGRCGAS